MTTRKITTSVEESDRIFNGEQMFIIRMDREPFKAGDRLEFDVCKDGRSVLRKICKNTYEVTFVADSDKVPVLKGWKLIAFRKVGR